MQIFFISVVLWLIEDVIGMQSFGELRPGMVISSCYYSESVFSTSLTTCTLSCLEKSTCTAATYHDIEKKCFLTSHPKKQLTYLPSTDNVTTVTIVPCSRQPSICQNNGICVPTDDVIDGYKCICEEHWETKHCEKPIERCAEHFKHYEPTNLCYYTSIHQFTYDQAITKCQSLNATLAIGNSRIKIDTILEIAKENGGWYLIGLKKINGVWQWTDGTTNFIQWRPSEPSGDGNCSTTFPDGYKLNDVSCMIPRNILCEQNPLY